VPTTLTGTASDPTTSPQTTGPASGDLISAAPMDNALQPILNFIAWLRTHGALVDSSNTFSVAQTIAALLTLSASDLDLTKSGLQSILKSGSGKLDIGTSTANDLELVVGGVVKAILDASTGRLRAVASTASGDAALSFATKDYVDAIVLSDGTSGLSWYSGWTGVNFKLTKVAGGIVVFNFAATAGGGAGTNIVTLTAGYRPISLASVSTAGFDNTGAICGFNVVGAGGVVALSASPTTGHTYSGTLVFPQGN